MPVKINVRLAEGYAGNDSRFDAAVRRLAPVIRQLRDGRLRRGQLGYGFRIPLQFRPSIHARRPEQGFALRHEMD